MKELKAFVDDFKAVFEPADIAFMAFAIVGVYFGMILITGIFG